MCNTLCRRLMDPRDARKFAKRIQSDFRLNWMVDWTPAVEGPHPRRSDPALPGLPIGARLDDGSFIVYNHARITVKYYADPASASGGIRVVGLDVLPVSVHQHVDVSHGGAVTLSSCDAATGILPGHHDPQVVYAGDDHAATDVTWSYDVIWEETDNPEPADTISAFTSPGVALPSTTMLLLLVLSLFCCFARP